VCKAADRKFNHPPLPNSEIEERVEL